MLNLHTCFLVESAMPHSKQSSEVKTFSTLGLGINLIDAALNQGGYLRKVGP